jgi:hypothetical protein
VSPLVSQTAFHNVVRRLPRKWEEAVPPTYLASTRNFYRYTLRKQLVPKFAQYRLGDICTSDLQIFLNQKGERYAPCFQIRPSSRQP